MQKSIYKISKMDCPSEEQLVRMKLQEINSIKELKFDIPNRNLTVIHQNNSDLITKKISELELDSSLITIEEIEDLSVVEVNQGETKTLTAVLIINSAFFLIEMSFGIISGSMGLFGDSLDMLADSFVYGLSLYVVGKAVSKKKKIAKFSSYIQFILAGLGFFEVLRRFLGFGEIPDYKTMIIVAAFAFAANLTCLYLLQKHKSNEAHIKASMIFTSNDLIVNLGVIAAGILVSLLHSNLPDLLIATIVFIIVMRGAYRILQIAK